MWSADGETSLVGTGEIKSRSGTFHSSLPLTNAGFKGNHKSGPKQGRYVVTVKLERERAVQLVSHNSLIPWRTS